MDIPLVSEGFADRSLKVNPGFLRNYFARFNPGSTSTVSLQPSPGLTLFANIANAPIRAMRDVDSVLFAVAGGNLYELDANGSQLNRGQIPGTIRPKMTDNGNQLVIPVGGVYIYDKEAETLNQVTLPVDLESCSAAAFVGQYVCYMKDGSGEVWVSDFGDASTIQALQFFTSEQVPDNNVSIHEFQGNLWIFGLKSTEVWHVTSQVIPLNPFENGATNIGCGARLSVASNEDYIVWLSQDRRVFRSAGGKPEQISSPNVDFALSQMDSVNDGEGFIYTQEGQTFYELSFNNGNRTFVCDLGMFAINPLWAWHERSSYSDNDDNRHRASFYAPVYGKHLVGDYQTGNIYSINLDDDKANDTLIRREFVIPAIQSNKPVTLNSLEIKGDVGTTPLNEDDYVLECRWSDTGADWGNWVQKSAGAQGKRRTQFKWNGLSQFEERFFHLRTTAPLRITRAIARGLND